MRVRMRTRANGPTFRADIGEIVEVAAALGKDLIDGGFAEALDSGAEPLDANPELESAARGPAQRTAMRPGARLRER